VSLANILTQAAVLEQANRVALGIKHAYDEAPETLRWWPCSMRYPVSGEFHHSRGWGKHNIHRWVVEVHIKRAKPGGLTEVDRQARQIIEAYQLLYSNNLSINDSCDFSGFEKPVSWEYGRLEWAGEVTFGIRFWMWAKEMLDDIPVNL